MIPFEDTIIISSYFEASVSEDEVKLLPFGHSRHYPLSFNSQSKKIIFGQLNFFNSPFFKNFDKSNYIITDACQQVLNKSKNTVIVINLLDNCFGHSLLKLFDAIKLIEKKEIEFDFLLILPAALKHFIRFSSGVNFIFVNLPFSELEKCFVLNKEIKKITQNYSEVFLAGAETYNSFNLKALKNKLNFFGDVLDQAHACNNIVFHYRSDYFRKWSGNKQSKQIIKLFEFLRPFFSKKIEFIVTGDNDTYSFPAWIKDARVKKLSQETDFYYNTLFNSSFIVIGLTGSHMLFPSLLSKCTVHLHPSFKYKNMAEDIVVNENAHEMLSAFRHLYYFGNYNCSDISALKLGKLVLIHFQGMIEKEYKIGKFALSQQEWIAGTYGSFNYKSAVEFRTKENTKNNSKINFRRLIDKFFK